MRLLGSLRADRPPIGEVQADPSAWSVAAACATEAYQVARAKGIALDFADPVAYVKAFGETIPDARPSMLLDHLAGRRAEVDNINGAIPREGAAARHRDAGQLGGGGAARGPGVGLPG